MKLEFDSIQELDAFLSWAGDYRGHILTEPVVPGVSGGIQPCTSDVAFDTPPASDPNALARTETRTYTDGTTVTGPGPLPNQSPAQQVEQAARRKRRTRAEIDADEAKAAKAREPGAVATETPAVASTAPDGANPFAVAETPAAAEPDAVATGDAEAIVTPFQHLTRAREFIAKHGMPKYNESFAKAELDANVMGYSAYQRALHMEALAALEVA